MSTSLPPGGALLLQLIAVPGALEVLEAHGVELSLASGSAAAWDTPAGLKQLSHALTEIRSRFDAVQGTSPTEVWSDVLTHEVRNAMTGVLGAVQLAARHQASDQDRGLALAVAEAESLRCIDLLERELQPRRGSAAQGEVLLDALADETMLLVALTAAAKSVSLTTVHETRSLSATVPGDELKQVLLNLLLNALAAVDEGGEVTVTTSEEAGRVKVTVADDGPGVLPEHLDRIFEAGFSLRPDGSGLGLAISRDIVRRLGGDLTVASTPAAGASFTIELPKLSEAR